jgi:histidine triad (HIT) family protein
LSGRPALRSGSFGATVGTAGSIGRRCAYDPAVPSLFTRIIEGELPGTFVWRDPQAVAFLSINPVRPGHTLVVPVAEVDHWIDLDPWMAEHLMVVAQTIAKAQQQAFSPVKVGLLIAGLEVAHTHLHVIPIDSESDLHLSRAGSATPEQLGEAAGALRAALHDLSAEGVSE